MKTKNVQDLSREINEKADRVKAMFDTADENGGEMSAEDINTVKEINKEIEGLEHQVLEAREYEDLRGQAADRYARSRQPASGLIQPNEAPVRGALARSLGHQFVDSKLWQDYIKGLAPTGSVGERTRVESPKLVVPKGFKALITGESATSGGAFLPAEDSGIYETLGRRPLTLRDIISVRTTATDLVEFVRMTARTNAAAAVAEATATSGSSGVKPEGGMTFERVSAAVKTIAEWVAATKRSLSDAGQLRGIIDDELMADLEEELEDQILNGSGVGENFEGLDTVSGTQDQAWTTDALVTTRKARTKVLTIGRSRPTAYVFNPSDWETIDLLKDNENRYYFGGPSVLGTPRLWGLPVVESEAQATGNGWVGDWRKAVLWDREESMVSVSDAHADFFIRNLVAILAELRAAFGVIRPAAFVEIDLTP